MSRLKLVIAEKNYSTWSMRPWLLLRHFGVEFEEVYESFLPDETMRERFCAYSPTGQVPVLLDAGFAVWDSLAICEHVSETRLDGGGWPQDPSLRAEARAICAEIHSGLRGLRRSLPMNIRAKRRVDLDERTLADVRRVDEMWGRCARRNPDGWLFGEFSIADCFYAPVAMRFRTYVGLPLSEAAVGYAGRIAELPAVREWIDGALTETSVVPEDEAGEDMPEKADSLG